MTDAEAVAIESYIKSLVAGVAIKFTAGQRNRAVEALTLCSEGLAELAATIAEVK